MVFSVNTESEAVMKVSNSITMKKQRSQGTKKIYPSDFTPSPYTVILGKGKLPMQSIGNRRLRTLVESHMESYSNADMKSDKSYIVTKILYTIKEFGGSFVRFNSNDDEYHGPRTWCEVTDKVARDKIAATFRDCLHDQYKSSTKNKVEKRRERKALQQKQKRRSGCSGENRRRRSCTDDDSTEMTKQQNMMMTSSSSSLSSVAMRTTMGSLPILPYDEKNNVVSSSLSDNETDRDTGLEEFSSSSFIIMKNTNDHHHDGDENDCAFIKNNKNNNENNISLPTTTNHLLQYNMTEFGSFVSDDDDDDDNNNDKDIKKTEKLQKTTTIYTSNNDLFEDTFSETNQELESCTFDDATTISTMMTFDPFSSTDSAATGTNTNTTTTISSSSSFLCTIDDFDVLPINSNVPMYLDNSDITILESLFA